MIIVAIFSVDNDVNKCNGSNEWRFKKLLLFNFFVMQIQFGTKRGGNGEKKPSYLKGILILADDRPVVSPSGFITELNNPETQLLGDGRKLEKKQLQNWILFLEPGVAAV